MPPTRGGSRLPPRRSIPITPAIGGGLGAVLRDAGYLGQGCRDRRSVAPRRDRIAKHRTAFLNVEAIGFAGIGRCPAQAGVMIGLYLRFVRLGAQAARESARAPIAISLRNIAQQWRVVPPKRSGEPFEEIVSLVRINASFDGPCNLARFRRRQSIALRHFGIVIRHMSNLANSWQKISRDEEFFRYEFAGAVIAHKALRRHTSVRLPLTAGSISAPVSGSNSP